MARESSIVDGILRYLNGLDGCKARKRHGSPYAQAGEPDIEACLNGQSIQLEVKQPGKHETKIQAKRLREWQDAGACVAVVTSADEVRVLVNNDLGSGPS